MTEDSSDPVPNNEQLFAKQLSELSTNELEASLRRGWVNKAVWEVALWSGVAITSLEVLQEHSYPKALLGIGCTALAFAGSRLESKSNGLKRQELQRRNPAG